MLHIPLMFSICSIVAAKIFLRTSRKCLVREAIASCVCFVASIACWFANANAPMIAAIEPMACTQAAQSDDAPGACTIEAQSNAPSAIPSAISLADHWSNPWRLHAPTRYNNGCPNSRRFQRIR